MKKIFYPVIATIILSGCSEGVGSKAKGPNYRTAPIMRSDIIRTVEATGTITPRNSPNGIPVGAQVNGKIIEMLVDYNSIVTNGQIVALIDPQVYEANYKSAVAQLHANEANVEVRKAGVKSAEAELSLAEKTLSRKKALVERKVAPQADLDNAEEAFLRARASLESSKASLKAAEAQVEQSKATSDQAKANLDYCTIRSPVNGVVIDRKVEKGETVVSSMNAVPVLTIAEDLKTIWVEATVPEADVGNIKVGQSVSFTADAYRRKFRGKVKQIRMAATTTNNVVTYPIIIEAENPDEMLFPGMTATLSIETARAENVVVVSAAAFRFRPKEEDIGVDEVPRGRKLWIEGEDKKVYPRIITEGVSDSSFIEIKDGEEYENMEAVIGYEVSPNEKSDDTVNPFKPKFPQRNKNKGTAPEPKKPGSTPPTPAK
jgi:HlyD family secretion protein